MLPAGVLKRGRHTFTCAAEFVNVILLPPSSTAPGRRSDSHYCPHCLRSVALGEARRRPYRAAGRRGGVLVSLLHCPTCDLVLVAEIEVGDELERVA